MSIVSQLDYKDGIYQGQTLQNRYKQGLGVFLWENGSAYYGDWKSDHIDGQGVLFLPPRTSIHGLFSKDQLQGPAVIRTRHFIFEGNWNKGLPDGPMHAKNRDTEITVIFENGKPIRGISPRKSDFSSFWHYDSLKSQNCDGKKRISVKQYQDSTFLGIWNKSNDKTLKPGGLGIMVPADQLFQCGQFRDGLLEGVGRQQYQNGEIYQGCFNQGRCHGQGIKIIRNEELEWIRGIWRFGQLQEIKSQGLVKDVTNPKDLMYQYSNKNNQVSVKMPITLSLLKELEDMFLQQINKQDNILQSSMRLSGVSSQEQRLSYQQQSTLNFLNTQQKQGQSQIKEVLKRENSVQSCSDNLKKYYDKQLKDIKKKPQNQQGHNRQAKSYQLIRPKTQEQSTKKPVYQSKIKLNDSNASKYRVESDPPNKQFNQQKFDMDEINKLQTQYHQAQQSQIYQAILDDDPNNPKSSRSQLFHEDDRKQSPKELLDVIEDIPQRKCKSTEMKNNKRLNITDKFQKTEGQNLLSNYVSIPSQQEESEVIPLNKLTYSQSDYMQKGKLKVHHRRSSSQIEVDQRQQQNQNSQKDLRLKIDQQEKKQEISQPQIRVQGPIEDQFSLISYQTQGAVDRSLQEARSQLSRYSQLLRDNKPPTSDDKFTVHQCIQQQSQDDQSQISKQSDKSNYQTILSQQSKKSKLRAVEGPLSSFGVNQMQIIKQQMQELEENPQHQESSQFYRKQSQSNVFQNLESYAQSQIDLQSQQQSQLQSQQQSQIKQDQTSFEDRYNNLMTQIYKQRIKTDNSDLEEKPPQHRRYSQQENPKSSRRGSLKLLEKSQETRQRQPSKEIISPVSHRNIDVPEEKYSFKEKAQQIYQEFTQQDKSIQHQPDQKNQQIQVTIENQLSQLKAKKSQQALERSEIRNQLEYQKDMLQKMYQAIQEGKKKPQEILTEKKESNLMVSRNQDTIKRFVAPIQLTPQNNHYSPSRISLITVSPPKVIVKRGLYPAFTIIRQQSPLRT